MAVCAVSLDSRGEQLLRGMPASSWLFGIYERGKHSCPEPRVEPARSLARNAPVCEHFIRRRNVAERSRDSLH